MNCIIRDRLPFVFCVKKKHFVTLIVPFIKVTMIKNLEAFGLDPAVVADTLQHQVQASCVLHDSPGAKNRVLVQIQGNQVQQVGKLLLGTL